MLVFWKNYRSANEIDKKLMIEKNLKDNKILKSIEALKEDPNLQYHLLASTINNYINDFFTFYNHFFITQFEKDLFDKCFKKWGVESQLMMLIEESAELIKSASKDFYRNYPIRDLKTRMKSFAEELADVQLMLDEFIYYFNLSDDVKYFRILKIKRLEKLLEKEKKKIE